MRDDFGLSLRFGFLIGVAVLTAAFSMPARADEEITRFHVDAKVESSSAVAVSETITVNAENRNINHGIYRDIPTIYADRLGNKVSMPIQIMDIQRDGQDEPYHIANLNNGIRIYVGDQNSLVSQGQHTYTIKYKVLHVIGYFEQGDEFYWNVTGNGWEFPIITASARIEFPAGSHIIRSAAYTGFQGSQGTDFVQSSAGSVYEASTTRALMAKEGLTVAAMIPKGFLAKPDWKEELIFFLNDNGAYFALFGSLVVLFLYLVWAWTTYGRDKKGVIIPRFDILDKMPPDLLRNIVRQRYDDRTFVALLVYAAQKGYIKIENKDKSFILTKTPDFYTYSQKNCGSVAALAELFGSDNTIAIPYSRAWRQGILEQQVARELAVKFIKAKSVHNRYLEIDIRRYYDRNTSLKIVALGIVVVGFILTYKFAFDDLQIVVALIMGFFLNVILLSVFWTPLNKYTALGQKMADYAAGLRLFLTVAEESRMNALFPKEITPAVFETFLPYAMALDVDQDWCDHFEAEMQRKSKQDPADSLHNPRLVHRNWGAGLGLASMVNDLSRLPGAISSASTPPGSNSGSGGGGSSGGGGGGGGGGGW